MLFTSCGSDATDETSNGDDTTNTNNPEENKTVQNVFYSIPSPVELGTLIQQAGASYDAGLLNPIENKSKYSSITKKALNMGVYGADLSITSIFDQTQESIFYLKCASALSEALGITGAFDNNTVSRMEANKGNRDSLLGIITDSYYETDDFLKENGRANVSALIIAGGWIEALYIGTQMGKNTNSDAIKTRIAELKGSLENLIGLLTLYKGQEGIDPLLEKINGLKTVYDGIGKSGGTADVKTDEKNKVTTIGGKDKMSITPEQFDALLTKTAEIRNEIIKP